MLHRKIILFISANIKKVFSPFKRVYFMIIFHLIVVDINILSYTDITFQYSFCVTGHIYTNSSKLNNAIGIKKFPDPP